MGRIAENRKDALLRKGNLSARIAANREAALERKRMKTDEASSSKDVPIAIPIDPIVIKSESDDDLVSSSLPHNSDPLVPDLTSSPGDLSECLHWECYGTELGSFL